MNNSKVLRERHDNSINATLRLKKKANGVVLFTAQPDSEQFEDPDSNCLDRPLFAHIKITDRCNMNCPYCYSNGNDNSDMDEKLLYKLIDVCDAEGIFNITWIGGEPLLYPSFFEVLDKTFKIGINQTILSNGLELSAISLNRIPKDDNILLQISVNNVWSRVFDS